MGDVLMTVMLAKLALMLVEASPTAPDLGTVVKSIVVEEVPLKIEELKGWGDQVRVARKLAWRGKLFGGKPQVVKESVNHGLWKSYRVHVADPASDLTIRFPRMDYVKGEGIHFSLEILVHSWGRAEYRLYSNGVRLWRLVGEADLDVRCILHGVVLVKAEPKGLVADLLLTPRVDRVELYLPNVDVRKLGVAEGPMAREMGDHFRKLLEDLLNDKEEKLPEKINRQLAKQWEKGTLRVSLTDWLARVQSGRG
jgi:hypothetical protein